MSCNSVSNLSTVACAFVRVLSATPVIVEIRSVQARYSARPNHSDLSPSTPEHTGYSGDFTASQPTVRRYVQSPPWYTDQRNWKGIKPKKFRATLPKPLICTRMSSAAAEPPPNESRTAAATGRAWRDFSRDPNPPGSSARFTAEYH